LADSDQIAKPAKAPGAAGPGHNSGKDEPVIWERWTKKRTFVRALEGTYGELVHELFSQPRVYHSTDLKWKGGPQNFGKKVINPGSAKVAQCIETHIDCFAPGGYGQRHGHMNSAVFYVLKGKGYDVHDRRRIDWEAGDALIVENSCVHQHLNDDPNEEAIVLVAKAKPQIIMHLAAESHVDRSIDGPGEFIKTNVTGTFALLSGGSSAGSLAVYNTCDNSLVSLSSPSIPTPPSFLKMVPAGNVTLSSSITPIPLQTTGLDLFFGIDDTGIDIIATNTSQDTSFATLCPLTVTLAQTTANTTFSPVHLNINQGAFHAINFFLSPDATQAYIVTTDQGVLVYNFNSASVSRIQLLNNAAPVAADITVDGTLLYVAGSDGLLHQLNTVLGVDLFQTSFVPLPNSPNDFCFTGEDCHLNLVAVKP